VTDLTASKDAKENEVLLVKRETLDYQDLWVAQEIREIKVGVLKTPENLFNKINWKSLGFPGANGLNGIPGLKGDKVSFIMQQKSSTITNSCILFKGQQGAPGFEGPAGFPGDKVS